MAGHMAKHKKTAEKASRAASGRRCRERSPEEQQKRRQKRRRRRGIFFTVLCAFLSLFCALYGVIIAGFSPFLNRYRNLWIETAMTTTNHRWLATAFFPKELIDEIIGETPDDDGSVSRPDDIVKEPEVQDILGQAGLTAGEPDSLGNEVLYNDKEQGVVIVRIKGKEKSTGNAYEGKLALIDDPNRLFLATTPYKGTKGEKILNYLEDNDAILGVNASPYLNPKWRGTGGNILGKSLSSDGTVWGEYRGKYNTMGFDKNGLLVVGKLKEKEWETYGLRDAMQFSPSLIVNGQKKITGSAGWGIQPRTIIGQRADGVVLLLEIDGRHPGYSMGATLGDCANILMSYGAVNACACDGGSSSVMAYDGQVITVPTSIKDGRRLPNAWLVRRKPAATNAG